MDWIEGSDYKTWFENLKSYVESIFARIYDTQLFTLHDATHCIQVEKMVKAIVEKAKLSLTPLERFLLLSAVWVHDIGMSDDVAREILKERGYQQGELDRKRELHHYISAEYLLRHYLDFFEPRLKKQNDPISNIRKSYLEQLARVVAIIALYHRKMECLEDCDEVAHIKKESIRLQLLAAILRLADTLHIDVSRFDPNLYAMVQIAAFDRVARLHWLKSFFVSDVHLNPNKQTITVTIDVPDQRVDKRFGKPHVSIVPEKFDEKVKNLEYVLRTDIEEDLVVVNKIFIKYYLPTYVMVRTIVRKNVIPVYEYNDFVSLLNELDMLFSPYTSKVIKRGLECIRSFCKHRFGTFPEFDRQLEQLLNYYDRILEKRPCHIGLRKIRELVAMIKNWLNKHFTTNKFKSVGLIAQGKKALETLVDLVEKSMNLAKAEIAEAYQEVIDDKIRNIFLFGYSSTVLKLLETVSKKGLAKADNLQIFILECSAKRRFTHSNLLEYNDGIWYALDVAKLGYKNVILIPDTAFASLANMSNIYTIRQNSRRTIEFEVPTPENSVVLFGTNGIDAESGDCGHTSGHLFVCIIANHYKIPVKVLSHSFKVGDIPWNPYATREGDWLTTQENFVNEIENTGIRLFNPREDRIPLNLINAIYTETIVVTGEENQKKECLKKLCDHSNNEWKKIKGAILSVMQNIPCTG